MDAGGVSRAVIQGIFWRSTLACESQNAGVSEFVGRRPDRLSAFAAINPSDLEGSLRIIKNARAMGFCGVGELCDAVQGFSFSDPEFASIVSACADEDLCICVHLNDNSAPDYPSRFETSNREFFGLASRRKEAVFIAAHFGGLDIFRGVEASENVYFDSAALPLLYPPGTWGLAASKYPQKVLFGSDYAMRLYPDRQDEADFAMILGEAKQNVPSALHPAFFRDNALSAVSF